ncbi:hypothetical protein Cantr_04881 [Candida viswanathii]|uniref:Uncharacterized protein n=1 Tax=Candida viswanathii TaxID=5486 RepID=A0A367XQM7_9ASCO|nr:hypothetical protein Cantr_04881 [Candida viswanathii]
MTSTVLSPCESCITLADSPQQFNAQYVSSYLASRPIRVNSTTSTTDTEQSQSEDAEFTIVHNYNNISIKFSSILCLINIHSSKEITMQDVTINHLFLYLFYHQCTLFQKSNLHIGQLSLAHLGKKYQFLSLYSLPTPTLLGDLKVNAYPTLLLTIKERDFTAYRFDIGSFLSTQLTFVDRSTGDVTYMDTLARKLKDLQRNKKSAATTTSVPKKARFRAFLKKIAV